MHQRRRIHFHTHSFARSLSQRASWQTANGRDTRYHASCIRTGPFLTGKEAFRSDLRAHDRVRVCPCDASNAVAPSAVRFPRYGLGAIVSPLAQLLPPLSPRAGPSPPLHVGTALGALEATCSLPWAHACAKLCLHGRRGWSRGLRELKVFEHVHVLVHTLRE